MTETNGQRKQTLKEWRQEFGIGQEPLAELAGVDRRAVGKLEQGQYTLRSDAGLKVLEALGISPEQVLPPPDRYREREIDTSNWTDGYENIAPRQHLVWWRNHRGLSQSELAGLAGVSVSTITNLEMGMTKTVTPPTRRVLAKALKVRLDKLLLPGDKEPPTAIVRLEEHLRADLRSKVAVLRRAYDFVLDPANVTHRAQDGRGYEDLLRDISRELKGE